MSSQKKDLIVPLVSEADLWCIQYLVHYKANRKKNSIPDLKKFIIVSQAMKYNYNMVW